MDGEDLSVDEPKPVDPLSVGARGAKGKKKSKSYQEYYAHAFSFLFEVPKYAGYGEHWTLTQREANELASKLETAVGTLPSGPPAWLIKIFEQYILPLAPWASFVWVAYLLTEPRIRMTRENLRQAMVDASQAQREAQSYTQDRVPDPIVTPPPTEDPLSVLSIVPDTPLSGEIVDPHRPSYKPDVPSMTEGWGMGAML